MELLGRMPRSVTSRGKYVSEFFNRKGELKRSDPAPHAPCHRPPASPRPAPLHHAIGLDCHPILRPIAASLLAATSPCRRVLVNKLLVNTGRLAYLHHISLVPLQRDDAALSNLPASHLFGAACLSRIRKLKYWSMGDVLAEKYDFTPGARQWVESTLVTGHRLRSSVFQLQAR